jgi:segregation and condensation protein A
MNEQTNENNSSNKYIIHIDNFDGPLDLLWSFIKKSKIDITEISLSHITEQYLGYLKNLEKMNISIAAEFIWMASELLYYKSKSLLPSGDIEDEYFVPPLPPELVKKLLEFKKYQQASHEFKDMFSSQSDSFSREDFTLLFDDADEYSRASLFDLLKAFANVLDSNTVFEQEEIIFDEILVSDKIEHIINLLKDNDSLLFDEIYGLKYSRGEVVATFLALLEMVKTSMIKVMQHRVFGEIRLMRNFSVETQ